jgi:prolyl oligopeptidase
LSRVLPGARVIGYTVGVWRAHWIAVVLLGCAAAAWPVPEEAPLPPAAGAPDVPRDIARLNAEARRGVATDIVHGMAVEDPYRALEADTPETRAWIAAQTSRTRAALSALSDRRAAERLEALLGIGSVASVAVGGERVFVTLREGKREQAALYVIEDGKLASEPLVDPLARGGRAALDWSYPSPDGRYVAFGISENGDERSVLQVVEVATRRFLPGRIEHAKWCSLSWLNDVSGFFYSRYPRPGEPDHDPRDEDTYFPRVFFHRLGGDPALDPRVFGSETKTDFPYVAVGDDDRWVVVGNFRGWTASDLYLWDRGAKAASRADAPDAAHPLVPVVTGEDKVTTGVVHEGALVLVTNIDAPRKRVVRVAPARAGDRKAWRTIVPESEATIEDWALSKHSLTVRYVADVRARVAVFSLDGSPRGDIALPARGSVDSLGAAPRSSRLAFVFDSFFVPPTLFMADLAAPGVRKRTALLTPVELHQVAHDLDTSAFAQSEAEVTSADGTKVHVYYVHRKDLVRDGDNPVLLTGYGGFDVSLLPEFSRNALYWLEQGGVYAVANLRGGGEYGEAWHRAGMLQNKPRVFEDFEAVIRWFSESRISRPDKIAISGGSNGGLLMGAMITRVPGAFRAAIADVGLYDMLRYPLFPPAALWISEYGDPAQPEAAAWLRAYSPYHQVNAGTAYPAVLIETADHDTRVHWAHSTKFAARLQDAQAGPSPIYFHMEQQQGHGRGTRLSDLVRRYVRRYAFLEDALGMRRK